jgi:hypothetical protein
MGPVESQRPLLAPAASTQCRQFQQHLVQLVEHLGHPAVDPDAMASSSASFDG